MSLLGKLFGKTTFDEHRAEAERLFAQGELGRAKLSFERALERARDQPAQARAEVESRIAACCDGLARARMAEAERFLADGQLDLGLSELDNAAETAVSPELHAEIEALAERAVRQDERAHLAPAEQSDDERFETLGGHWEDEQYEEYLRHGAELKRGLLLANDGEPAAALETLERLLESAQEPRYLHYDIGRLRLLAGDKAGGRRALEAFIACMNEGEGGEARLGSHMELAQLHHEENDFDGAVAQYDAAVEALPDDPRPYIAMGAFMRRSGHAAEALDVLNAAASIGQSDRPHWMIVEQLGLAHADLEHEQQAIELLEDAIEQLVARHHVDLPPEGTARLAQLHEKNGNVARAADLFSMLAKGSDVTNRVGYQLEAARLMIELGHARDARQLLQRAQELCGEAEGPLAEHLAELRGQLEKLS